MGECFSFDTPPTTTHRPSTMAHSRKFFVGGNFKMNGTKATIAAITESLNTAKLNADTEVVISPPFTYLTITRKMLADHIELAAQDSNDKKSGAYTGEVSAEQLVDVGVSWVILGHSERRSIFQESSVLVAKKTKMALEHSLKVILCVGESLEEREANHTIHIVTRQLEAVHHECKDWTNIVIAYEPVWAIGTGKVATPSQAQEVHREIRAWLQKTISEEIAKTTRIIYGGSVSAKNCRELAAEPDIDGFLVGGASLKPEFVDIINAQG